MNCSDKYKLNKNIASETLYKNDFRNGVFKRYIYKNIIQLIIGVDVNENDWYYQVYDVDHDTLFSQYYDREYGKNDVVKELDKKVDKIFKEMVKKNILVKRGK